MESSTDWTRPAKARIMKTGKNTASDIRFPRLYLLVVVHHCEHIWGIAVSTFFNFGGFLHQNVI